MKRREKENFLQILHVYARTHIALKIYQFAFLRSPYSCWSLLLLFLSALVTTRFVPLQTAEVGHKVAPFIKLLLQIVTLNFTLIHEMINKCNSVIFSNSLHLIQTLISVETQLFPHFLNFLSVRR